MKPKQVLIAFDQLVNTLFNGWADETFSSRCWRWHRDGKRSWPMYLVNALFFWESKHCLESYASEVYRRHLPPELRQTKGEAEVFTNAPQPQFVESQSVTSGSADIALDGQEGHSPETKF